MTTQAYASSADAQRDAANGSNSTHAVRGNEPPFRSLGKTLKKAELPRVRRARGCARQTNDFITKPYQACLAIRPNIGIEYR
jgi:hypothetical protein